ncbi:MAG: phosphoribosylanthranilate isomerase [Rhizomicrobium sp.]
MTVQVKICGLTRVEDAAAVVAAGADFAGLVFHPGSPRHLRPEQAKAIAECLRNRVRIVALFVDPVDDFIAEMLAAAGADLIQLHGREPPVRVAEVRARFGRPVIKAIPICDESDFETLPGQESVADMLLFDSRPGSGGAAGGHGRAFDWQLLRGRRIAKPWLLAGGLGPENVARAVQCSGAPAVDVSSGVEAEPGTKSGEAIKAFVAAARAAHQEAEKLS